MDFLAFEKSSAALRPAYIFGGEVETFRRRGVERLAKLAPEAEVVRLDAREASVGKIEEELKTRSFFTKKKLIVVSHAEDFFPRPNSKNAERLDALAALVEGHRGPDILVLDASKWDRRFRGSKALEKTAELVECAPLPDREVPRWFERRAKELGGSLAPGAAEELFGRTGNNLSRGDRELEKLRGYAGTNAATVEDVRALVEIDRTYIIWDLLDAVAVGNAKKGLTMLRSHLREGEKLVTLVAMLLWQVKRLGQGYRAFRKGGASEIRSRIRMPFDKYESFTRLASSWGPSKTREWLRCLLEADLDAKSGGDEDLAGEMLVIRLARCA